MYNLCIYNMLYLAVRMTILEKCFVSMCYLCV